MSIVIHIAHFAYSFPHLGVQGRLICTVSKCDDKTNAGSARRMQYSLDCRFIKPSQYARSQAKFGGLQAKVRSSDADVN
jgi:hypothetical protein